MFSQGSTPSFGSGSGTGSGTGHTSSSVSHTSKFVSGTIEGSSPLWAYVTLIQDKKAGKGNASWRCNYCNGIYKGSYFRVRSHLLREKGNGITMCSAVTNEYLEEMKQIEKDANERAKKVQVPFPTGTISLNPPRDVSFDGSKRRRGSEGALAK